MKDYRRDLAWHQELEALLRQMFTPRSQAELMLEHIRTRCCCHKAADRRLLGSPSRRVKIPSTVEELRAWIEEAVNEGDRPSLDTPRGEGDPSSGS